jgi:hypothetical protein
MQVPFLGLVNINFYKKGINMKTGREWNKWNSIRSTVKKKQVRKRGRVIYPDRATITKAVAEFEASGGKIRIIDENDVKSTSEIACAYGDDAHGFLTSVY